MRLPGICALMVASSLLMAGLAAGQALTSDKSDYRPGKTAPLTGNGIPCALCTITCPGNVLLNCGDSSDPSNTGSATSLGCTVTFTDAAVPAGCAGVEGIDRTWKATNACGDIVTCVQEIRFVDHTGPVIECPGDRILDCGDSKDPTASGTATATDNCDPNPTITFSEENLGGCTGQDFDRTWTATDACGNTSSCVQHIIFRDTTAPVITCPPDEIVTCGINAAEHVTVAIGATATDNCDPNPTITWRDDYVGGCGGDFDRTWTATDACGNSSSCVQQFRFGDTTAPQITCPGNLILRCGDSTAPAETGTATVTDDCDPSPVITSSDANVGGCTGRDIDRTWTATDACGNHSSCVQHIIFRDTTPPVITCPGNLILDCGDSTAPASTGTATATDVCDPNPVITSSDANVGGCTGRDIDRTWTATDACGNWTYCVQHIIFRDTRSPVISCPADRTLPCESDDEAATALATATDNCTANPTITYTNRTVGGCTGRDYDRTWTATDACGNTSSCVQHIRFTDTTKPVISCPPSKQLQPGQSTLPAITGTATATDNCANPTITYTDAPAGCQGKDIDRTWKAVDACGNVASCVQRIGSAGGASTTASNNGPLCAGKKLYLYATTVSGGTYKWTGPNRFTSTSQNPSISNAQPSQSGTYCVTVTAKGCTSAPSCTDVVVNPAPPCTITGPVALLEGSTGELCGPAGNYRYAWSTGDTTRCIPGKPGFTYTLKVTDRSTRCECQGCSFTIKKTPCACNLGYTDGSKPPRSKLTFEEQQILTAFDPKNCKSQDSLIRVYFADQSAMLLGARRVIVKTSSTTTTTDFPVTPNPSGPTCVWLPRAGSIAQSGDLAGTDRFERPWFPALFITDITDNAANRSGDWQQGGTGIPPHKVCGRWKAVVRTLDKRSSPPKVTFTLDPNPTSKNYWNLGPGSDVPSGGFAGLRNEGYGAEVAWNLNYLNLVPGRTYRLQFMFQDGDQTKSNGDCGQACVNLQVPVTITTGVAFLENPAVDSTEVAASDDPTNLPDGALPLPQRFELSQNVPNPFQRTTAIRYSLPEPADVSIRVFSIVGQEVAMLVNGPMEAGRHSFTWNAANLSGPLPPGVYVITMRVKGANTGAWHQERKTILLR